MTAIDTLYAFCVVCVLLAFSTMAIIHDLQLKAEWRARFADRLVELSELDGLSIDHQQAQDKAAQYIERFADWEWITAEEAAETEYAAILDSL